MTAHEIPPQFEELLDQCLDNRLTEDQFAEFEKMLHEHPEARKVYYDQLDIKSGIQNSNLERLKELDQIVRQGIASSPEQSSPPASKNSYAAVVYLFVAAASVSVLLLTEWLMTGHFFWDNSPEIVQNEQLAPPEKEQDLPYVATLARSFDCKWGNENPPQFSGQRLLSKNLTLLQGIAEFRFDSGVRLVLEGPTTINIDSANCATIKSGSFVLHGYESSPEFELITPQARFYDIGTEYGARVDEEGGTDLHVFQGEVRVQPEMELMEVSAPLIVTEGNARHIDTNRHEVIDLKPDLFKREVPGKPKSLTAVRQELLAYDSFHPDKIGDPIEFSNWHHSGFGWQNPWRRHINKMTKAKGKSLPQHSLQPSLSSPDQQIGCIELERGDTAWRTLERPIRLDTNAIYYISFFIQQSSEMQGSGYHYGNLSLVSERQEKQFRKRDSILFGINSDNFPTLLLKNQIHEKAPPLLPDTTYFYVAKIVASEQALDQVFLRVFYDNETIPEQEPLVWTCNSTPFDDSNIYQHVRMYAGKKGCYLFDELRIGSSWESVVNLESPTDPPRE